MTVLNPELGDEDFPCDTVVIFNGEVGDSILLQHTEQKFENLDLKTQQYFQDELDCKDIPHINDLERPVYDVDCNEFFQKK